MGIAYPVLVARIEWRERGWSQDHEPYEMVRRERDRFCDLLASAAAGP